MSDDLNERVKEELGHEGFLPTEVGVEIVNGHAALPGAMPEGTSVIHLYVQKGTWISQTWGSWPDLESDQGETIRYLAASVAVNYKRFCRT